MYRIIITNCKNGFRVSLQKRMWFIFYFYSEIDSFHTVLMKKMAMDRVEAWLESLKDKKVMLIDRTIDES